MVSKVSGWLCVFCILEISAAGFPDKMSTAVDHFFLNVEPWFLWKAFARGKSLGCAKMLQTHPGDRHQINLRYKPALVVKSLGFSFMNQFATGVVDTIGKFPTGVVDIVGKLPPVLLTPMANIFSTFVIKKYF